MGFDPQEPEQRRQLQGLLSLPPLQRDLLAMAANELIEDVPRLCAPFSDDPDLTSPPTLPATASRLAAGREGTSALIIAQDRQLGWKP